jgi:hypothetical protein
MRHEEEEIQGYLPVNLAPGHERKFDNVRKTMLFLDTQHGNISRSSFGWLAVLSLSESVILCSWL